jgi:hypothetical protein
MIPPGNAKIKNAHIAPKTLLVIKQAKEINS